MEICSSYSKVTDRQSILHFLNSDLKEEKKNALYFIHLLTNTTIHQIFQFLIAGFPKSIVHPNLGSHQNFELVTNITAQHRIKTLKIEYILIN